MGRPRPSLVGARFLLSCSGTTCRYGAFASESVPADFSGRSDLKDLEGLFVHFDVNGPLLLGCIANNSSRLSPLSVSGELESI
jgi:hypothetical protein